MDKLIIKISDWIGNQMFQYAFGRFLSQKLKTPLYIDISSYDNNPSRKFELNIFNIQYTEVERDDIPLYKYNTIKNKFLKKIYNMQKYLYYAINLAIDLLITPLIKKPISYYIQQKNSGIWFYPEYLEKGLWYYDWFWQSEQYFPDIRTTLLQDFTLKKELDNKNQDIQNKMKACNSIAIHIRRWDYTIKKSLFRHSLYPCSLDYYKKAMDYMKKNVKKPVFFFFSDDPQRVKDNIKTSDESYYIDQNTWIDSYKDMILMSSCQHNIIANSTFSRRGAWLNKNDDKIIVTPKVWFRKTKWNNMTNNLIPRNRITF